MAGLPKGGSQDQTVLDCGYDGWPKGHKALATCNTPWGVLIGWLKGFSETGNVNPASN